MNLFIPPEGAMQFEVIATRLNPNKKVTPFSLWVYPPKDAKTNCGCNRKFYAVEGRVPKEALDQGAKESGWVCFCNGRIIE